jgi:hypothetical protein
MSHLICKTMNRYRITALEDVDVCVSDEHLVSVVLRGAPCQVPTRRAAHWEHLSPGESRTVCAVHAVRGDLFEERPVTVPGTGPASFMIHDALRIEELAPSKGGPHREP